MMTNVLIGLTWILGVLSFFSLYRAIIGPTSTDRVIAINVLSTKVTTLIILVAIIYEQYSFIDVAIVYAMIGFTMTVGVSKYIENRKLY